MVEVDRNRRQKLYLKGCPRCGGDLISDWDHYGAFRQCLQCGHMIEQEETGRVFAGTKPTPREKAA